MRENIKINDSAVLEITLGDITGEKTMAIANAANEGLRGGGGVDGAIHRAGGPQIMEECRKIGHCPTGTAVITSGGKLQAKYVIHTVGPVWRGGSNGEAQLLASCYRSSLELARENKITTISFPSISTGVYSYPLDEASAIALRACYEFLLGDNFIELVRFVLFDQKTFSSYKKALNDMRMGFNG